MSGDTPRFRMFAGPNGSGKSTLKTVLRPELLGVYLNPDEVERELKRTGGLDLRPYRVGFAEAELKDFLRNSSFLQECGLARVADLISVTPEVLIVEPDMANSYLASILVDFIRRKLLEARASFTLETVMSHPSKIAMLHDAQERGYRTYLYYVATEDPEINVSRVRNRVKLGGHDVPEEKIIRRYHASLELLVEAIRYSNRAYLFDNSREGQGRTWLAEVTEGRELEIKTDQMPAWFKHALWDKIVS